MDQNSTANNTGTDAESVQESEPSWAPMGGNAGDGGFHEGGALPGSTPGYGVYNQQPPPPENNSMNTYPPQPSPQMQYQQGFNNPNNATMGSPPPASAPPPPGSYAARSAQAYANHTVSQPAVSVNSNPASQQTGAQGMYGTPPPQQHQPTAGGYAARAAQAQAAAGHTSGFTGAPTNTPNTAYGAPTPQNTPAPPGDGSFAARSQQAYASAGGGGALGTPQASMNNAPSIFASPGSVQQQSYGGQQQPPQTRPFVAPGATPPHAPTTATRGPSVAQSGYAARSAQAYATSGQPQQQQQPPSTVVGNSNQYGASPPPAQSNYGGDRSVSGSTIATNQTMSSQQVPSQYGGPQQMPNQYGAPPQPMGNSAQVVQQRLLTDATRKVQEHSYYMKQAMDQNNLPSVLERAAYMAGELGVPPHGHNSAGGGPAPSLSNTGISVKLTPKNYYELFMRALEDMSSFEDYLLNMSKAQPQESSEAQNPMQQQQMAYGQGISPNSAKKQFSYTMRELYDCVQYCPRVLSRLYLQISAGSALVRSGEVGAKWVLNDLIQCVKCEQNPIRGLFLRNHLLTVLRDKLPDTPEVEVTEGEEKVSDEMEPGNVKDSYEFVMENFMEMNKLWVRLQYMPGDGNTKEVKKRRERERNDLRILVGTNLVRISQLEGVTSKIYGESILPRILDHIVTVGDPLSQAYLMDCLVQVFPDEYHIETMPILLNVCPRLRDKVNVRTILQGLMDRLSNYLADEELLDESDTNQVKLTLARDSFGMFEECVQKVFNARGPKLTSKEVIRLQTALLQFSLKRDPGNMEQIAQVMGACVTALQQANASYEITDATMAAVPKALDDVAVVELEKLLSIPVDSLALRVLELKNYVELVGFLPWANRRAVAKSMLEAVDKAGAPPKNMDEIQQLFSIIEPLTRSEHAVVSNSPAPSHQDPTERATSLMAGLGVNPSPAPTVTLQFGDMSNEGPLTPEMEKECALVSKLVQLLDHENTDVVYEMLSIAREQIRRGSSTRASRALVSVVFAALKLVRRIQDEQEAKTMRKEVDKDKINMDEEEKSKNVVDSTETAQDDEAENKTDTEASEVPESESSDVPPAADESKEESVNDVTNDDEAAESPKEEKKTASVETEAEPAKKLVTARQLFIFVEQTVTLISKARAEIGLKLLLEAALTADKMTNGREGANFAPVAFELLSQCFTMYEERISEASAQRRSVTALIGGLLRSTSLSESNYESLITKTAQFSAKLPQKADQCRMVAECSHLFFPVGAAVKYSNAQRALECLQRSLKLADAATSANASNMVLFVDLLEHYLFFLENKNPAVTAAYVTGLGALIKEYLRNATDARVVLPAKTHFISLAKDIKRKKVAESTSELFAGIEIDTAGL